MYILYIGIAVIIIYMAGFEYCLYKPKINCFWAYNVHGIINFNYNNYYILIKNTVL